jgi:hypothetical protein
MPLGFNACWSTLILSGGSVALARLISRNEDRRIVIALRRVMNVQMWMDFA